jgi:hypothetical protein
MFKRKNTLTKEQRKLIRKKYFVLSIAWGLFGIVCGAIFLRVKQMGGIPTFIFGVGVYSAGKYIKKVIDEKYDL